MSINDLVDELESRVLQAALKAKAVETCRFHPDIIIYNSDTKADSHAYALATVFWKSDVNVFEREQVMEAMKDLFISSADGECPQCG